MEPMQFVEIFTASLMMPPIFVGRFARWGCRTPEISDRVQNKYTSEIDPQRDSQKRDAACSTCLRARRRACA